MLLKNALLLGVEILDAEACQSGEATNLVLALLHACVDSRLADEAEAEPLLFVTFDASLLRHIESAAGPLLHVTGHDTPFSYSSLCERLLPTTRDDESRAFALKVLEFLAHKITSNVRELEGALNRLVAYANLVGRPITLDNTQEVLHDILRANDRRVTIEEIQKRVAEHYNIRLGEMYSARRSRAIARPRQVAMYLSKELIRNESLSMLGAYFGRTHSTLLHAHKTVIKSLKTDDQLARQVDMIRRNIASQA